jgi:tetratricopeptide (TPR) repeat protein
MGPLALPTLLGGAYSRPAPLQGGLLASPGAGSGPVGPILQILQSAHMGTGYTLPVLSPPPGLGYYPESLVPAFKSAEGFGPAASPTTPGSADEQAPPPPENRPTVAQAAQTRLSTLETSRLNEAIDHFRAGRYEQARAAFKMVAAIQSQPGTGQLGALHADFAAGNYQSAAAALPPLLPAGRVSDAISSNFGASLYDSSAKFDEHVVAFRRRFDQLRQDPPTLALAAYIFWAYNRPEQARNAALELVTRAPDEAIYRTLFTALGADQASTQPASQPAR